MVDQYLRWPAKGLAKEKSKGDGKVQAMTKEEARLK